MYLMMLGRAHHFVYEELPAHAKLSDFAMAMAGLFIFTAVINRLCNKGPMLWPVLGIIPSLFYHIDDLFDWLTHTLIKSGGTFYWRGMWMGGAHGIVTIDPANVEYLLRTKFSNFPKGRYYRERFGDLLGDGIFNADGEAWLEQRRAATMDMHSARFMEYSAETIQNLVHNHLLVLVQNLAAAGKSVDLQDVLLRFTFDNICMAAFGIGPGCLAVDLPEVPFARAFEEATEKTLFRFMVPPFIWKTMKLFDIGSEYHLRLAVEVVHEFAEKAVRDRQSECLKLDSLSDRSDLLSRLIEAQQICRNKYPNKFLKDFCISFILAGRDTSSVALTWFFWLLHNHPSVEKQIMDEIVQILRAKRPSTDTNDSTSRIERRKKDEVLSSNIVFTVEDLKQMNYVQAAISEALRLYPPVPIGYKEVVEDDVFSSGARVQKGDRVLYCVYSMARSEAIWGKDCREFKPERWIKDGKLVSESQFKYVVFNGGPRMCLGKKFAFMQMKMVAASVLARYSVEVVEGHVVAPKITTTFYMKNGLQVIFKPRFLDLQH